MGLRDCSPGFAGCGHFAQLNVHQFRGLFGRYQGALPDFEKSHWQFTVTTARGQSQGNGPSAIGAQLRRGEPADG